MEYYEMAKNQAEALFKHCQDENSTASFIKNCAKKHIQINQLVIPKIQEKQLEIKNVFLNIDICHSLSHTLYRKKGVIQALTPDNNGLNEQMSDILLDGLQNQESIRVINWRNNFVTPKIANFINRNPPNNLLILRIEKCKISVKTINQILENLEHSQINRLALVDANLASSNLQLLQNVIKYSQSLLELDISWNQLNPK